MQLELDAAELDVVREVLASAVSDLSPEIAGTDDPVYRRGLRERRELLRGVLARLGS
jgi:hypothetical protein